VSPRTKQQSAILFLKRLIIHIHCNYVSSRRLQSKHKIILTSVIFFISVADLLKKTFEFLQVFRRNGKNNPYNTFNITGIKRSLYKMLFKWSAYKTHSFLFVFMKRYQPFWIHPKVKSPLVNHCMNDFFSRSRAFNIKFKREFFPVLFETLNGFQRFCTEHIAAVVRNIINSRIVTYIVNFLSGGKHIFKHSAGSTAGRSKFTHVGFKTKGGFQSLNLFLFGKDFDPSVDRVFFRSLWSCGINNFDKRKSFLKSFNRIFKLSFRYSPIFQLFNI